MATVGIIANPESGRDIRRLVSHASVFDNMEKVNIVERILTTLQTFGVKKILAMPESFGIVPAAADAIDKNLKMDIEYLPIRILNDWRDTYEAVNLMKGRVNVIIVIGGDGTNRIVAKLCNDVPIMPFSTGTNNAFPYMIEATIVGEAAAAIAMGVVDKGEGTYKAKRLEIVQNDELKDIALIDIAVTTHTFIGAKAVWKPNYIKEIISSRCLPYTIGFSSVAGIIGYNLDENEGLYAEIGYGDTIKAPIAPGVFTNIGIKNFKPLKIGDEVAIKNIPSLFALDGEREFEATTDTIVKLTQNGPMVIDYKKTLKIAAQRGFFKSNVNKK